MPHLTASQAEQHTPHTQSFKAIESVDTTDDTQWLTFWTVLSVVQFAEFWTDILRRWLPYYNEAKLALIIWLGAFRMFPAHISQPQHHTHTTYNNTGGAHLIYEKALRPFLKEQEAKIDEQLDQVENQAKAQLKQ